MATDFADTRADATRIPPVVSVAWREWLYERLAGRPTPVVQFSDGLRSAASLWAGAREWTQALRASGMSAGDTVVCAMPAGAAMVQLLVACVWDGFSLVLCDAAVSDEEVVATAEAHDARLVIHDRAESFGHAPWWHRPVAGGWPDVAAPWVLRAPRPATPGVPALTDQHGPPMTHAALLDDVRTRADALDLAGARVLVTVDWSDAALLARGVLLPLLVSEELYVVPADDRVAVQRLLVGEPITHVVTEAPDAVRTALESVGRPITVVALSRTRPHG